MRLTIEVVADTRAEVEIVLRDAVTAVRRGNEKSGVEVNACMGDYRITVEDEPEPKPFAIGARVTCLDRESAYFDAIGTVVHSGPRMTGVRWDGWSGTDATCIKSNSFLALVKDPPRTDSPKTKD